MAKRFFEHLNPPKPQIEKYVSMQEETKITIGSRIGSAAKSLVVGGAIAGGLAAPLIGGAYGLKRIMSKPEQVATQPQQQTEPVQPNIQQSTTSTSTSTATKEKTFHEKFHENLQNKFETKFPGEYPIIMNAAKRNGIAETDHENLSILFSIRHAENGEHGKQFGVLHKNAGAKPGETEMESLDRQAGWAASTLMKNRARHEQAVREGKTNKPFVQYFGNVWAPIGAKNDPKNLNANWQKNVTSHVNNYMNPE
jgi:hypothetical protein